METKTLKQVKQLKLNVINIRSILIGSNKKKEKMNADKKNREKRKLSFAKKQKKEKELETKNATNEKKVGGGVLATPSMGILDKLFNFGGLLLGGILVNAADAIAEKGKEFYENNKELFDTIGNFLSGVKDAAVGLLNSFTGPASKEGEYDDIAKFDDLGNLQSGKLKDVENIYSGFGILINKINKAMGGEGTIGNALISDKKVLAVKGGKEGVLNKTTGEFQEMEFSKEQKKRYEQTKERGSGMASFREDAAENAALQESFRGRSTSPTSSSPGQYGSLLDFIGSGEGGYNSMNQGTQGNSIVGSTNNASSKLGKNLTNMTIGEIMDRQEYLMNRNNPQISDYGIFAAGKYQIIPGTMPGAVKGARLSRSDKFTPQNQDKLGMSLIMNKRPYVGKYLRGENNDVHGAMMELAREFASMPNPNTGRSLYGSGNKAFHSVDEVREALIKARTKPRPKITPVPDKGDMQMSLINQPMDDESDLLVAIQPVNTIQAVPYMMPFPVASKGSSSVSTPQLSALWSV